MHEACFVVRIHEHADAGLDFYIVSAGKCFHHDGHRPNHVVPATVGGLSNSMLRLGGGTVSDETSSKAIDKIPGIITLAENEKLQIDKLKITKSSKFNLISDYFYEPIRER